MSKPPYRVPSMAEIAAVPPNGYTTLSTFSGCGGSCLGFKMAGFRAVGALEFIQAARDTYAANFPGVPIETRDVRQVSAADLLERAGLAPGELDVLEGSPPCASFSTAGKREGAWGKVKKYSDKEQRSDDLFFEFARLLADLKPKVFVAENVSGLVRGKAKGYFLEILKALKACGYDVAARLLDAKWLGVPQGRLRLIFVGVRKDLGIAPRHPTPLPYQYTLREALPGLVRAKSYPHGPNSWDSAPLSADKPAPSVTTTPNGAGYYHHEVMVTRAFGELIETSLDEPAPTVLADRSRSQKVALVGVPLPEGTTEEEMAHLSLDRYAIGREWDKLKMGEQSAKYFNLVKPNLDEACPTVTATGAAVGAAGVVHPLERRKFTIAELRRICGFPDDFQLLGTYEQQWERLGRAVPPVMMSHVARVVREILDQVRGA